jgi:uncharacterized membrane protein
VPATYLVKGMTGMMLKGQGLGENWASAVALIVTTVVGSLVAMKLFRWEKEEKIRGSAKWWVVVVLLPFIVMGVWTWLRHQ